MESQASSKKRDTTPNPGTRLTTGQQTTRSRSRENRNATNKNLPNTDDDQQPNTSDQSAPTGGTDTEDNQEGPIRNIVFPTYKLYRRQNVKLSTAKHHVDFLTTLINNHQAPKGLKPKVTLTTAELAPSLYIRWEQAHIELANTLRDTYSWITGREQSLK